MSDFWISKKRQTGHTKKRHQARPGSQVHVLLCMAYLPGRTCILYRSLSFSVRSPWHAAPRSHNKYQHEMYCVCSQRPHPTLRLSVPRKHQPFTSWNPDIVWDWCYKLWNEGVWFQSLCMDTMCSWESEPLWISVSPPRGRMTIRRFYQWSWHQDPRKVRIKGSEASSWHKLNECYW